MGTLIYKTSVAQQNGVAASSWVKVTFNTRQLGNLAIVGVDTAGFYNKWVNLVSNNAEIVAAGDYNFFSSVRSQAMRTTYRSYLRAILERTETGSLALTSPSPGIARISVTKLAYYANVGNPTTATDPWYGTNTITVSGATDPAYNITGNIVAFDTNSSWIEYDGIVGTPGADTASSATMEVGVKISNLCNGDGVVFNSNVYDFPDASRELQDLLTGDKIWLEFWHNETNTINLVWGKADCYMLFRRNR